MLHSISDDHATHSRPFKSVISSIFAIVTGSFAAIILYSTPHYSFGITPFQADTIGPVSINFSSPLENTTSSNDRREVIGFLPYWAIGNKAKVYPEYMDQIIYFGVTMDKDGNLLTKDSNGNTLPEWNSLNSSYFREIKSNAKKTNTKVSIAVKNFNNSEINSLISSETATKNAIISIKKLVRDYELDGINIDFEYVTKSDFPTMKFYNNFLVVLVEELRAEKADIMVSFDVNATAVYVDGAYDMVKIGEVVDQIIIMGYDYHRATSDYAGPVAPIQTVDNSPSLTRTLDSLKGRVDSDKIILGLPLYGYEWQTTTNTYRSKTVEGTGAVATYKRVRELISNRDDVSIHYDSESMSPWLTYTQNGRIKQIYYEDEKSLSSKIEFVHDRELAGIALWSLGYEGDYIEPWVVIKEGMWD